MFWISDIRLIWDYRVLCDLNKQTKTSQELFKSFFSLTCLHFHLAVLVAMHGRKCNRYHMSQITPNWHFGYLVRQRFMPQPHSIICSWCLFVSKRFPQFGFVLYARPCIMCSCFVLGLKHLAAFIDSFLPLGNTGRPDRKICFTACRHIHKQAMPQWLSQDHFVYRLYLYFLLFQASTEKWYF